MLSQILQTCKQKSTKVRIVDGEFVKQINFKGVKFPVHKTDYGKIENQNNIFIDVFGYEDERPYRIYTSKHIFERHVDLISENSHYALIKDFNRFMTNKQNITVESIFLSILLTMIFQLKIIRISCKKLSNN